MKWVRNERGGASLMYVTMLALVLMIVTPAILAATSNETLRRNHDGNASAASQLAVSAMEMFLAYLYAYDDAVHGADPVAYIQEFPGLDSTEPVSFLTPEGTSVSVDLSFDGPDDNGVYRVAANATVGTAQLKRTKTIKYALKPPIAPSPGLTPNDDGRYEVPEEFSGIFVQSDQTALGVPQTVSVDQSITNLETIIGSLIDAKQSDVDQAFAAYEGVTSPPPVVVKTGHLNISEDTVFGTPATPVVVIADSVTYSKMADVTVYGSLLVNANVMFDGANSTLKVSSVDGNYGDAFVKGTISANNSLTITVSDALFAGSMSFPQTANSVTINAVTLTVQNHFSLENSATLNVALDVAIGSMEIKNNSSLNATAGDFLVEGDFTAHNNVSISTGGVVASGGDFMIVQGNSAIETGGGTTSIIDLAEQINDSGPSLPGAGWVINREG